MFRTNAPKLARSRYWHPFSNAAVRTRVAYHPLFLLIAGCSLSITRNDWGVDGAAVDQPASATELPG
jgi:prophage maintenance system killer protein